MKVTILGNNAALPAYGRHPSAQVVLIENEYLMIDCGEGTQTRMQVHGIKWSSIGHILISHLHGDHYFGLPGLVNSMSLLGRTLPLHIYAPAPLEGIMKIILEVADTRLSFPCQFHSIPEGFSVLVENDLFTVRSFPLEHRIPCFGFLVEGKTKGRKIIPEKCGEYKIPFYFYRQIKKGEDYTRPDGTVIKNEWLTEDGPRIKKYAYCSDTVFTGSYLPYIQDADMIYHEATYLEEGLQKAAERFHCTARQAAEIAKRAKAKQLLLGHFSSKYKELDAFYAEASAVFPDVLISAEGLTYEI